MNPKISIVTVCYQAVNEIEGTLQSVLSQTYRPLQYVVIDGASTDGTKEMIAGYEKRIKNAGIEFIFISEPDAGIYDAMNKGVRYVTGEWVNFMNAGDVFASDDVMNDAGMFERDYDIIYGDVITKGKDGEEEYIQAVSETFLTKGMPFCHQSTFTKTSLLKENEFDTTCKISADYKFFLQSFLTKKKFCYIAKAFSIFSLESQTIRNIKIGVKEAMRIKQECGVRRYNGFSKILLVQKAVIIAVLKRMIPKKILRKRRARRHQKLVKNSDNLGGRE